MMNFILKVWAQRTVYYLNTSRDVTLDCKAHLSANGTGVCISNFTMDGMENVQISNKLWIEGDQQKCLGRFSLTLHYQRRLELK